MSEMHHTIDAVYENGMFRPLHCEGLAISEGTQVRITVDDAEMPAALRLATAVYDGLSESAIREVEEIALDRRNFSGRQNDL
jgi:predicted DNA-binding antitoxin AbrB/MazE fold protein